ncbi:uncharacterized protein LOC143066709 [Mytilus galloprovincialis]|uniref:uncharacterized protein LOC143066709 n=1 Tax=Mytilus galloprovincialis TaxID=29158 RepID=UPI003F7C569F
MNKMSMLCRWLMSNFSFDQNCLTQVLSKSYEIGYNDTVKALSWKITREFYKKYEQSLKKNIIDIYPAYQCQCHNLAQGQKCLLVSKKLIVIECIGEKRDVTPYTFWNFKLSYFENSKKDKSSMKPQYEMEEILQKISHLSEPSSYSIFLPALDGYVASSLFKKHRKLSLICPSTIKSSGYGQKHTILACKCVQLFCHRKGIIPLGENHFPRNIVGIPTDILQGRGQFASTKLRVGDKIGTTTQQGTLGGFYDYLGHKCFLTCAHVLLGINELTAPLDDSSRNRQVDVMLDPQQGQQMCGKLIRRIFSYGDPSSTSVDAALVLIESHNFNIDQKDMIRVNNNAPITCHCLGLESPFINHNYCGNSFICSTNSNISIVAAGAFSQFATEYSSLKNPGKVPANMDSAHNQPLIRAHPVHGAISLNSSTGSQDFLMYNQMVMNIPLKDGDSGTCIYITKSTSQETGCVGMANSFCSGYSIVTPLDDIIRAMNR